jgi:hypothetical protein
MRGECAHREPFLSVGHAKRSLAYEEAMDVEAMADSSPRLSADRSPAIGSRLSLGSGELSNSAVKNAHRFLGAQT